MIKTAVARRYAKALFELLDTPSIEPTRLALNGLGEAFTQSADLRHAVASPVFPEGTKLSVLTEVATKLECPPVVKRFLGQLVKKNRVSFLPDIAEAFAKLVDESKGMQQVLVSSANALPATEQDRITTRLRDLLKRDVDVTFHTEPEYVAGLHIRLGSTVVDSTVRGRLSAMQRVLTKE